MFVFRLKHPRYVASLALESAVVFGMLYVLARLNALLMDDSTRGTDHTIVYLNGLVFLGCLLVTRRAILGEADNLRREFVILTIISVVCGFVALVGWFAYFGPPVQPPALLIAEGIVVVPLTLAGWRWFSVRYQFLDGFRERILIVGADETARQVARWIGERARHEYRLVGFADEDDARLGHMIAMGARVLTRFGKLEQFSAGRVDRIVVALEEKRGKLPILELLHLRLSGIAVEDATSFFERASGKLAVETMLPSWLVFSEGFSVSAIGQRGKRVMDIVASLSLLVLSAPLMLLTAVLIALETGRPILYHQPRMGRKGIEFDILKFRSMVNDAENKTGPAWAGHDDPRITRVGKIIRRFRIDELPQLINVLRGEMSFVGPRPERRFFVAQLEKEIRYYSLRSAVRPGITGWAQVNYRYGATTEDARQKLKYDLFYIKHSSPLYDLWIVLKTVKVVLTAAGAR